MEIKQNQIKLDLHVCTFPAKIPTVLTGVNRLEEELLVLQDRHTLTYDEVLFKKLN